MGSSRTIRFCLSLSRWRQRVSDQICHEFKSGEIFGVEDGGVGERADVWGCGGGGADAGCGGGFEHAGRCSLQTGFLGGMILDLLGRGKGFRQVLAKICEVCMRCDVMCVCVCV